MTDITTPSHWSAGARDAFATTTDKFPDLAGSDFAALVEACELIAAGDHMTAASRSATSTQEARLAAAEARLSRTAAAAILSRVSSSQDAAANAGRKLARTRHSR